MIEIKQNNKVYAIYDTLASVEQLDMGKLLERSTWYGDKLEPLQASRMDYHTGKTFKVHKHKLNPRTINYTQEALIILRGKAEIEVYNENKELLEKVILNHGDIILLYRGYHGLKILHDNTIMYEIKSGQFSSVEQDKEFFND